MTIYSRQFNVVRTIAITMVVAMAIFGVVNVGAQEAEAPAEPVPTEEAAPAPEGPAPVQEEVAPAPETEAQPEETPAQPLSVGIEVTPSATCVPNPTADLIDGSGSPFNPWNGSSIVVSGGKARVTVKNNSTNCTYTVNLASYEVFSELGNPPHTEYIRTQELFDRQTLSIAPGATQSFVIDVPDCNYQTDLFVGTGVPQTNPDFGNPPLSTSHTLLDWAQGFDGGLCGATPPPPPPPPPSPECVENARVDIVDINGNPFNPWDGSSITTANGQAQVSIRNISSNCTYNVALTSYETDVYVPGNEQEFIDSQKYFDSDIRQSIQAVGPGQTATLVVDVPACNWQTDLYTFINGATVNPVPPDFAELQDAGTHTLLDWLVDADNVCEVPQCPITAPAIATTPSATGTVGVPFSHDITISGVHDEPVLNGTLPAGLTLQKINSTLYRISGTPTAPTVALVTISVANECGNDSTPITITIGGGQCSVIAPLLAKESDSVTGTVGTSFSYTIQTTQGGLPLAYEVASGTLPTGLTLNGNIISGTPTQATDATVTIRVSNQCGFDTMTLRIVVTNTTCPLVPPDITSGATASGVVGSSFSYAVTVTGGVPITVNATNLPPGLSFASSTISGTPTTVGTFTTVITATNQCGTDTINLVITITGGGDDDDDDDDDDDGGGGGRRRPKITLFSEPDIAGASISLSQIPYTGLGSSLFQIFLFVLGLAAISGGLIYMLMRRLAPRTAVSVAVPASAKIPANRDMTAEANIVDENIGEVYEEYTYATAPVTRTQTPAPVSAARMNAPANIPVESIEQKAPAFGPTPIRRELETISVVRLQSEARTTQTLISDDGAELIAKSADGDEKKAVERLHQLVEIAKTRYPREDGWLILDKGRVRETLFISTLSMIPLFIEWVIRGEDKKVFTFLRMLKHQEQPVGDFMRKVVAELDAAHRARLEGAEERSRVNTHVNEVTYHLSDKELEAIVAELLHGVDERYDSVYTSVRLALVRVLDMIKERSLRSVGGAYAFSPEESA